MKKVKIYGAGSIGNHLAQACRRIGWEVVVVDSDRAALKRMKNDIYPTRYGSWDETIQLFSPEEAPEGGFDIIFLGTPPDVRIELAREILKEEPKILQLEKPVCTPELKGVEEFLSELKKYPKLKVVTGYDHVVSKITEITEEILKSGKLGQIQSLDVEFRETWKGIFAAHPWLRGPKDSYLGFWQRGGGASGEHSHATNLWQHFSRLLGLGRVNEVSASLQMVKTDEVDYAQSFFVTLATEKGFIGRVVQDVIAEPVKKWMRIQGKEGFLEWQVGYSSEGDMVKHRAEAAGEEIKENFVAKKRPDDFYAEVLHIQDILEGRIKVEDSPISLERGLDTMMVIAAAHLSHQKKRVMGIDYSKGYSLDSIKAI